MYPPASLLSTGETFDAFDPLPEGLGCNTIHTALIQFWHFAEKPLKKKFQEAISPSLRGCIKMYPNSLYVSEKLQFWITMVILIPTQRNSEAYYSLNFLEVAQKFQKLHPSTRAKLE